MLIGLHHIQLAMPEGREDDARRFYGDILGLSEVAKPAALQGRGGVWFGSASLRLHLGVESDFRPARKAHPAFEVAELGAAKARLDQFGLPWTADADLPGITRIFVADPFGNRIELLQIRPT
jgi:catechol 2,3-dioxygenase-like lactoylglutathione lyase family enzyme